MSDEFGTYYEGNRCGMCGQWEASLVSVADLIDVARVGVVPDAAWKRVCAYAGEWGPEALLHLCTACGGIGIPREGLLPA